MIVTRQLAEVGQVQERHAGYCAPPPQAVSLTDTREGEVQNCCVWTSPVVYFDLQDRPCGPTQMSNASSHFNKIHKPNIRYHTVNKHSYTAAQQSSPGTLHQTTRTAYDKGQIETRQPEVERDKQSCERSDTAVTAQQAEIKEKQSQQQQW